MLVPIVLVFGCIFFLCVGAAVIGWAGADMFDGGLNIKNIIALLAGIAVIVFARYCIEESSEYYHKKVFTTSVPAQIDTTITIKNGIADTLYTYNLMKEK